MFEQPNQKTEGENDPEKMVIYERNMLQAEILQTLGFERSKEEEHEEQAEWMSQHRKAISDFIDSESSEAQIEVRRLAKEGEFTEAALIVISELSLEK